MSPVLAPLCLFVGIALLLLGAAGRMLRPSDGTWFQLAGGLRAALVVLGLVALLLSWKFYGGKWPFQSDTVAASKTWSSDIGGRPATPATASIAQRADYAETTEYAPATALTEVNPTAEPFPAAPASAPAVPDPAPAPAPEPLPVAAAEPQPVATPAVAKTEAEPECECPPKKAKPAAPKAAAVASAPRKAAAPRAPRLSGDTVSVCEVTSAYGSRYADGRVAVPSNLPAGSAYADSADWAGSSSPSGSSGAVTLRNRLGPGQRREVLRVHVDGRQIAELSLSRARPSASARLNLPRRGDGVQYRLSGYTEYDDGSGRVPIQGEGWLDAGSATRFEVRVADPDARDGFLYLEPA